MGWVLEGAVPPPPPSLSLSLSLSHTHTHTQSLCRLTWRLSGICRHGSCPSVPRYQEGKVIFSNRIPLPQIHGLHYPPTTPPLRLFGRCRAHTSARGTWRKDREGSRGAEVGYDCALFCSLRTRRCCRAVKPIRPVP